MPAPRKVVRQNRPLPTFSPLGLTRLPASRMAEGPRVVFVSVRGRDASVPRTRRKRALGVSDDTTWEAFTQLVCQRLALRGVAGVYHGATGALLRSLEDLQDIEDLEVEETPEEAGASRGSAHPTPRKSSGGGEVALTLGEEAEKKYGRKVPAHARVLQQLLPSWAAARLGLGSGAEGGPSFGRSASGRRDGDGAPLLGEPAGRRRRAPRRGGWRQLRDPRALLLLLALASCAGTLVLLASRLGGESELGGLENNPLTDV